MKIEVDTSRPYKPGDRGYPEPTPDKPMVGHFTMPEWVKGAEVDLMVEPRGQGGQAPRIHIPGLQTQGVRHDSTPIEINNVQVTEVKGNPRKLNVEFDVVERQSGVFTSAQYYFVDHLDFAFMQLLCNRTHCSTTIDRVNKGLQANTELFLSVYDNVGNETIKRVPLNLTDLSSASAPSFTDFKVASCDAQGMELRLKPSSVKDKYRISPVLSQGGKGEGASHQSYVIVGADFTCAQAACVAKLRFPALLSSKIGRMDLKMSGENGRDVEVDVLADPKLAPILESCLNQVPVRGGPSVREVQVKHADQVVQGGGGALPRGVNPPK